MATDLKSIDQELEELLASSLGVDDDDDLGEDDDDLGEDDDDLGEDDDDLGEDDDDLGEDDDDLGEDDDDLGEDDDDLGEDDDDLGEDDDDLGEDDDDLGEDDDDLGEDDDDLGEDDDDLGEDDDDLGEDDDDLGEDDDDLGEDDDDLGEDDDDLGEDDDDLGEDIDDMLAADEVGGLDDRIERIQAKIRNTTSPRKRLRLKKRLARLKGRQLKRRLKMKAKIERGGGAGDGEYGLDAEYLDMGNTFGLDAEYLDVGETYGLEDESLGGVEGYLDMIEQYGEDVESEDAMGIVPLVFPLVGLTGYLLGKGAEKAGAKIRYNRHQLVASLPYLKYKQLRRIARNPFRKRWVRSLALAEMRRRRIRRMAGRPVIIRMIPAGGMVTVTRQVPMARIVQFSTRYPKGIIGRRRPTLRPRGMQIRPRNVVYTTPAQQAAMPQFTNADRRAAERGLPRPVLPVAPRIRSAPVKMPVRPAPRPKLPKVPRKAPSVLAIEAELARSLRAARNNAAKISAYSTALSKLYAERARTPQAERRFLEMDITRFEAALSRLRGSRNVDLLTALGADGAKPTLGDAMLANPFTTLLVGAAVFGVGALVGKERIVDATLSVTEKVTGAAHGAVTSARTRRS